MVRVPKHAMACKCQSPAGSGLGVSVDTTSMLAYGAVGLVAFYLLFLRKSTPTKGA